MTDTPTLTLYNTLTRKKEPFIPSDPKRVTMYNCGPTVYSYAHIGNARAAVAADVLFRVLRHMYGEDHVVYARNITDVDDKIIAAAKEQGVPISDITEKFARIYNEDLAALNCLPPTHQPKATDNIGNMIDMISKLIDGDFAYESQGHVFFDVSKYDDYGKLSGNTLDALRGGDRVGEGEIARKKNPADFVLWKPETGGVGWDAPFGRGRPGWHIECSAMIKQELGETIDIHCGGQDLKFPHHENEIAQSECSHNAPLAKYWVHNAFLNMGKEKMSKSLGNVALISDLLKDWDGEVIRLALLKAHYRSELIWTEALLKESKVNLDNAYKALQAVKKHGVEIDTTRTSAGTALDDLNVVGLLHSLISYSYRTRELLASNCDNVEAQVSFKKVIGAANLLGLLQKDPEEWFRGKGKEGGLTDSEIDALIVERAAVRAAKNWARADEIRDVFAKENIVLEDSADGTSWRRG
ncbi:MAG: cysteine--tRNA ligase [Robiginitomaculum sp.]